MMRKNTAVLCALVLIAAPVLAADYGNSSGGTTQSNSNPANPNTSMTPPSTTAIPSITGTVQKVDVSNSNVKVKDDQGNVQMVKVDANTQITRNGTIVELAELQKGDVVVIKNSNSSM